MQITKAMELVASSKLQAAQRSVPSGRRPYFNALYQTITRLAGATRGSASIYTKPREVKKHCLYIVIAGDRGLAGGYNSQPVQAGRSAADAGQAGLSVCITDRQKGAGALRAQRRGNGGGGLCRGIVRLHRGSATHIPSWRIC